GWGTRVLGEMPARGRPGGLVPRARARRRLLAAAAAAILILLVVVAAVPAVGTAGVPSWAAGLRSAVGIDTSGGDRASSWGYTLQLIGVYADDRRTIVVLKGDAGGSPPVWGGSLTGAGQRVGLQQSVVGDDGYYAVKLGALSARPSYPVPVTLHLVGGFLPPRSWTLTFTLNPDVPRSDSYPAPG